MFDVFLLMYFTDCASNRVPEDCADNKRQGPPNTKDMIGVVASEKPLVGLFDRFIPYGKFLTNLTFLFCNGTSIQNFI